MSEIDQLADNMYDVPELRGMNGTAYMDGLERYFRFSESRDVKEFSFKKREADALMEKKVLDNQNKGIDGLGQLKGVIPAREFFRWRQDQGDYIWEDKHFLNSFYRDNPQFKVKGYTNSHY